MISAIDRIHSDLESVKRQLELCEQSFLFKENERLNSRISSLEKQCKEKQILLEQLELTIARQGIRIGQLLREQK